MNLPWGWKTLYNLFIQQIFTECVWFLVILYITFHQVYADHRAGAKQILHETIFIQTEWKLHEKR